MSFWFCSIKAKTPNSGLVLNTTRWAFKIWPIKSRLHLTVGWGVPNIPGRILIRVFFSQYYHFTGSGLMGVQYGKNNVQQFYIFRYLYGNIKEISFRNWCLYWIKCVTYLETVIPVDWHVFHNWNVPQVIDPSKGFFMLEMYYLQFCQHPFIISQLVVFVVGWWFLLEHHLHLRIEFLDCTTLKLSNHRKLL